MLADVDGALHRATNPDGSRSREGFQAGQQTGGVPAALETIRRSLASFERDEDMQKARYLLAWLTSGRDRRPVVEL